MAEQRKAERWRKRLVDLEEFLLLPQGVTVALVAYFFGAEAAWAVFGLFVLINVIMAAKLIWERINRPRVPPSDDMPGNDGACT